jgi:hypothetical protein
MAGYWVERKAAMMADTSVELWVEWKVGGLVDSMVAQKADLKGSLRVV